MGGERHCGAQQVHLVFHLHHGSPYHVHTLVDEVYVGTLDQSGKVFYVGLAVNVNEELGLGMKGVNQALQLRRVCMSRYEVCNLHFFVEFCLLFSFM